MDGWESRRRRVPGHDWCIVQLGMRGIVHGVNVDTSHFTGNFPSHCSIEAIDMPSGAEAVDARDRGAAVDDDSREDRSCAATATTSSRSPTAGRGRICGSASIPTAASRGCGSTARSRSTGTRWRPVIASSIWPRSRNGGLFLDASDTHYGTRGALVMPDRAKNMGDGWETRRSRGSRARDWAIVRLGAPGVVSKVEIDTNHYKGNYPDRASLEGCLAPGATLEQLRAAAWSRDPARDEAVGEQASLFFGPSNCRRPVPSRMCGSTSFRTAASAACVSMARSHPRAAAEGRSGEAATPLA